MPSDIAISFDMPKSKTLPLREIKRQYLDEHKDNPDRHLLRKRVSAPTLRAECDKMPRPCPFVGCKYHLFMHLAMYGDVKLPFGEDVSALETMAETCTLDVADSGPQSQYRVSRLLNMTQQAVLQIEQKALMKVRRYMKDEANDASDTANQAPTESEAQQRP